MSNSPTPPEAAEVVIPQAVVIAVRYTFRCPREQCDGYILTADGRSSWKNADLPKDDGPLIRPCQTCGQPAMILAERSA